MIWRHSSLKSLKFENHHEKLSDATSGEREAELRWKQEAAASL